MSEIKNLIEGIASSFDEFKKINDQRLDEERKGNQARAKELAEQLDRIEVQMSADIKEKRALENTLKIQQERLEILEAANDRPKATIQEKLRDEYNDVFWKFLRSGFKDFDSERKLKEIQQKRMEVKDVLLGTTSAGGFALPEQIATTVDSLVLKQSEIVANVKNVTVGTSDYKELISIHPSVAGASSGMAGWVSETGSRSATSTPSLRERAPTFGELYAYPQASNWSLEDIFFDVQNWLTNEIAEGFALTLSAAIATGDGSSKPTGMLNTTPVVTADYNSPLRAAAAYQFTSLVGFSPSSPNVINMDALINMVYTLNPRYRQGAKFAMNTITQGIVRRLKSTQGLYYWEPSMQVGQPDRLLGYPVFTWEQLGNANTVDAFCVAFGDFTKGYTLAARKELSVTRDEVTNPGYTRFYVRRRYGGCVTNNDAIKFLRNAD